MNTTTNQAGTLVTILFAAIVLFMLGLLALLWAENSRMKAVLIDHTMNQLEREYDEARSMDEAHMIALHTSLEEAFTQLTELRGLSQDESELIHTAISLTDQILEAATSRGIRVE